MRLARGAEIGSVVLAWSLAAAWVWKAVTAARGMRRLPNLLHSEYDQDPPGQPRLAVIVPACNEAAKIAACIRSLLAQVYRNLHIVAVDDRSIDQTGAILDELAASSPERLTVLHVAELPAGWLGKTHAMAFAARHAQAVFRPEWLLFTDGDVLFHPQALRRSLVAAAALRADHLVTLPTTVLRSAGEATILGYLQVLGLWGVRLWRVSDPRTRDSIGVGAFNMLRADSYQQVGGFEALRMQILDDLSLARRIKNAGLRQQVVLAPGYVRVHWAAGVLGIVNTMTKNLFAVVEFRVTMLLAACCGVLLVSLAPCVELFWSATRWPAALALVAVLSMYITTSRFSRIPVWTFLALPVSTITLIYALLRSSVLTLWQGGVIWRGAFYSLRDLRRAAIRPR